MRTSEPDRPMDSASLTDSGAVELEAFARGAARHLAEAPRAEALQPARASTGEAERENDMEVESGECRTGKQRA